jgi:leucyl aminopeptidase
LGSLAGKPKHVVIQCPLEWLELATEAVYIAALNPAIYRRKHTEEKVPEVIFVDKAYKTKSAEAKKAIQTGMNNAEARNLMRILGATPPNILSTEVYAEVIQALCKQWKVACKRCTPAELKKYELLNAVSLGSGHDSQLLVITINPKKGKTKNSTAFFGKGLCYDSGGVQGKGNYMKSMKEDMSGSASVLGTIRLMLLNHLDLRQTTHFLLPLAENMMGNYAMRADDVWKAGDGQMVEIGHTDAEGRLVLADAICYAKANFKNIDQYYTIATLTGSCVVALGELYTGAVNNNEESAKEVEKIGRETGELVLTAPWDMDFDDNNTPIADVSNQGEKERDAGWIKGGLFMYRFIPKADNEKDQVKFCHLDIAGSIDMRGSGRSWRRKGFNSGVGVKLMTRLLTK